MSVPQFSLFDEDPPTRNIKFVGGIPIWTGYGPAEPLWRLPVAYSAGQNYTIPQSAVERLLGDDLDGFCSIKIRSASEPVRIGASLEEVKKAIPCAVRFCSK